MAHRPRRGLGAQYSLDGKRIAVQAATGIYIYDSASLSETGMIPVVAWDNNAQWSHDSSHLATSEAGSSEIDVWDIAAAKRTLVITRGVAPDSSFSYNGHLIAIGGGFTQVTVRDATSGKVVDQPAIGQSVVTSTIDIPGSVEVELSNDGARLAVRTFDGRVRVFKLADGATAQLFEFRLPPQAQNDGPSILAFSPDSKRLATLALGGINVFDAQTGQSMQNLADNNWPSILRLVYSQDGRWLIGLVSMPPPSRELKTLAWDASTGKSVALPEGFWLASGRAFSPDGNWRLEASGNHIEIRRASLSTDSPGVPRVVPGFREGILSMALGNSAAGHDLLITTPQGVEIFNADSGTSRQSPLSQVGNGPRAISFSPDGRSMATVAWAHPLPRPTCMTTHGPMGLGLWTPARAAIWTSPARSSFRQRCS